MNKTLHHTATIRARLRSQIKEETPKATKDQDRPQLGSTTDRLERNNKRTRSPSNSSLSSGVSHARSHRHLQTGLEVSGESRGLSNLTPARSRLFKLIGRVKGMRWSCSKRLAYMVANLFAKESEKRRQKHGRTTM